MKRLVSVVKPTNYVNVCHLLMLEEMKYMQNFEYIE
jgi:hypothetical protein